MSIILLQINLITYYHINILLQSTKIVEVEQLVDVDSNHD